MIDKPPARSESTLAARTSASTATQDRQQLTNEQYARFIDESQQRAFDIMKQSLEWDRTTYRQLKTDEERLNLGVVAVQRERRLMREANRQALLKLLDADAPGFNSILDMADTYSEKGRISFLQNPQYFKQWQDALSGK